MYNFNCEGPKGTNNPNILTQLRTPSQLPSAISPCPGNAAVVSVSSSPHAFPAGLWVMSQTRLGYLFLLMPPNCHSSWSCWLLLCLDYYLVFISLICQGCVIRCKIKMKSCQEPVKCVLRAALPLLCVSIVVIHAFYFCLPFSKPQVGRYWKKYAPAAHASSSVFSCPQAQ